MKHEDELKSALATAFLVIAACAVHYYVEPRFFYWDDAQHTFAPVFYTIGERLREGDWPAITWLLWQGGFLVGEGIYQLFNPISLLIYALLPSIQGIPLGMALHASVWLVIAALGVFALSRRLGATPMWATLAGFSYATSPYLLYWLAANWANGAVAFSVLPWALYFLARPVASAGSLVGLTFFTYLVGVSGWIHAMIALAAFGLGRVGLPDRRLLARHRIAMALCLGAGALFASPQLLATIAAVTEGARASNTSNAGMGVATLEGVLLSYWPTFTQPVNWLRQVEWPPPSHYAGWFLLPAAILALKQARSFEASYRWLIWPSLIILIGSLGPEQLGPMRWPLRFLPAAWAALIPLAAMTMSRYMSGHPAFYRKAVLLALSLAALLSWQQQPDRVPVLLVMVGVIFAMCIAAQANASGEKGSGRTIILFSGTFLIMIWMTANYPVNSLFPDYLGPGTRSEVHKTGVAPPASVVQVYSRVSGNRSNDKMEDDLFVPFTRQSWTTDEVMWVPSGNMTLWRRERQVNGYTPVEMLSLKVLTCGQSIFGWTCDGPAPTLLAVERSTGQRFIDLMGVDAVIVSSRMPKSLEDFSSLPGWIRESPSGYVTVFRRPQPERLSGGTVSHLPAGARVLSAAIVSDEREVVLIDRPAGFEGGTIAFARAYYPGHVMRIDGRQVELRPLGGVVVAAELPPGEGQVSVEVSYQLPMPVLWRLGIVLGLLALLVALWLASRTPRLAETVQHTGKLTG